MKQLFRIIVSVALIFCITSVAVAAEDIRISLLRDGDDLTPYAESIYFTRYTPWFKTMHLVTDDQVTADIMGGEGCQQIRCFDISPVDSNLILAGSDTSGVWITKNGGEHWYNTHRNMVPYNIADVMCHPKNKDILFAYSYGKWLNADSNIPGIYRSVDGGRTWERTLSDYVSTSKIDKLFAYDNQGNIYAVTGKGIVKSTDNGATWVVLLAPTEENASSPTNMIPAKSISVSEDGNTIVACYGKYAYDSVNETNSTQEYSLAGINIGIYANGSWQWSEKNVTSNNSIYALAVQSWSPLKMVASYYDYFNPKYGLAVTSNGGNTWTAFKDDNGNDNYSYVNSKRFICKIRFFNDQMYITYDNANKALRYIAVSELDNASFSSGWKAVDLKTEYNDAPTIVTAPGNMYIAAGIDACDDYLITYAGAVINKYDFKTEKWSRSSGGYSGLSVNHFYMDDEGNMILSRVDGNIIVSDSVYTKDNVPTFTGMPGPGHTVATMTVKDPFDSEGDRYIVWNGSANLIKSSVGIIVTEDGGNSYVSNEKDENGNWVKLKMTETDGKSYPNRVSDPLKRNTQVLEYVTIPGDKTYIYSSCAISPDNGTTWEMNDYFILDICDKEPNKMMAVDIYGENHDGKNATNDIMYSEDYGKTWTKVITLDALMLDGMEGFFDASDSNRFYWKSSWKLGIVDIEKKTFTSKNHRFGCGNSVLRQNPDYPNHLLLGTQQFDTANLPSLLESLDGGETWHVVPGIYGARNIREIQFSTTTNEAFLGSHNGTIVYEYDNFWHYTTAKLTDGTNTINTCLDVYKDSNGKKFILSPTQKFDTGEKIFTGWKYKNELYKTGAKIYID